jgi:predicted flap endonuclease-1-like 5' DNA nuclease
MIALTWQTMLVLVLAYFAGCIVGCLARKMKGAEPASAVPATAGGGGLALARAAADAGPAPLAVPVPPRPSPPQRPAQEAFRRADRDAPSDAAPPTPAVQPSRPEGPRTAHPTPPPIVAPPVSAVAAVAAATAAHSAPASGDDFTRIRAIDRALEAKLHAAGVTRYGDIATWTSDQVKAISETLGFEGRIERENWIEQAHILARGGVTQYATTIARTAPAPTPGTAPAPAAVPIAPASPPDVASRAAFALPRHEEPMAPAVTAPSVGARQNLQRIGGINTEIEGVLNAHGVTRYSQVAGWSRTDIGRLEALLGFSGRINRENWIEQAQILANGGATAYSREIDRAAGITAAPPSMAPTIAAAPTSPTAAMVTPPAPSPMPAPAPTPPASAAESSEAASAAAERNQILAGMRSVRSEAYRGEDHFAPPPSARAPDDLKRIRGIGVLLERKLNAMGVTSYEQIANWTADDVGTVNNKLEFKGRIERENWIEQARILASGGHTDFSRRFERGEV